MKSIFKSFEHQVKDLDESKGVVTIYINAFGNEDSDGDISLPGSFKRTFKNNGHTIQHWLNHERDKLLGVPIKLYEDDFGAVAVSQLNIRKQLGKDVFEDYKLFAEHGKTLQHSVRVMPVKFEEERDKDRTVRKVSEWKLVMEYSTLYGWGANQQTPLIDIKSLSDLELMMREGNYSDEKGRLIEETYNKLKRLLESDDPQDTPEKDPSALEADRVKYFLMNLNF
ncbi:MAG TPA: HK97 family phage prohead protease [Clostridia bacterium]|nr:HK97 family phage prohead protease [Clostridia bacterium]